MTQHVRTSLSPVTTAKAGPRAANGVSMAR